MVLRNLHSSVWHTMTSSTAHNKFTEAAMHGPLSHIRVGRCMPEKPFSPGWAVACLASTADKRICLHQTLCVFLQNPTPNYPLLITSSLYKFLSGARPPLHHSTLLQTPISVHGRVANAAGPGRWPEQSPVAEPCNFTVVSGLHVSQTLRVQDAGRSRAP